MVTRKLSRAGLLALLAAVTLASTCDDETAINEPVTITVVLSAASDILARGDTIARDTVRFLVTVLQGADTIPNISASFTSSADSAVTITNASTGEAVLTGLGSATVRATITPPSSSDQVFAELVVPVDSFLITITASSPVLDAGGQPLVGDTVTYSTSITKAVSGAGVPVTGQVFTSSDPAVIRFIDNTRAVLEGPGVATVSVVFDEPLIPGAGTVPIEGTDLDMNVADFSAFLTVESNLDNSFLMAGDTLVSDDVTIRAFIVTGGGAPTPVSNPVLRSSDASIIQVTDSMAGTAVFADTGTATVTVLFSDDVPQRQASLTLRVTTFRVDVTGPTGPTMGDTVQYAASVTDTRDGSAVTGTGQSFVSTDPSTVAILNNTSGLAFARDTGSTEIRVTYTTPALPGAAVEGALPVSIAQEVFYGSMSDSSGAFLDNVTIFGTDVHRFSDSTLVQLASGTVLFRTSFTAGQLQAVVGAGADTSLLTFQNLLDDQGNDRDNVVGRFMFNGLGGVADPFEPNDAMPLVAGVKVVAPFDEILSWDPSKVSPADTNFFYIGVLTAPDTFDISAEWQQNADLDFKVCLGDPFDPPTTYNPSVCARPPSANTAGGNVESVTNLELSSGTHVIAFYCVQNCTAAPITYRVIIQKSP